MTKRILRLNQLLKKELSQIFLREVEFPYGVLVTITRVETSSDVREAKAYISVMVTEKISPSKKSENGSDKVFQILNRQIYNIQQALNKRLKMRPVPLIRFVKESKTKEAGRIEEILERIKKKG